VLVQESGFSRREDVFTFYLVCRNVTNFALPMRFVKIILQYSYITVRHKKKVSRPSILKGHTLR
jgi:hypothetical protein